MVVWISTSQEEASALERGAVGHESAAMATLQAIQAMAAVPAEDARFVVPLAEQATLIPHHEFSDHIPVIDLSGDPDATIAAVAHAAASWGIFQTKILEKDGEWHGVAPVPGAIVILMGTAFQMITNDVIKAVYHRAVVNTHARRISLTTAINPSKETLIMPVSEMVDEMHPALYRPFNYSEFRVKAFEDGVLNSLDAMEKFRNNAKPTHLVDDKPALEHLREGLQMEGIRVA